MSKIKKNIYFGKLNSNLTNEEKKLKISDLCKECLDKKWYTFSLKHIYDSCPFCEDAIENRGNEDEPMCNFCICPEGICLSGEKRNLDGYVQNLLEKYDRTWHTINDLNSKELDKMICLFKNYIIS